MSTVRPFRALRPAKEYASRVIALPYDVVNRKEAAQIAGKNPYSFFHISRSEVDLPDQPDEYDRSVYEKAKSNLAEWLERGILVRDEKPMLYIYRLIMDGRAQTGIVGCVSVDEYSNGTIKKHELTRVEKEIDRINHFDVCNANTEPVFLTYRDDLRIRTLTEGWIMTHEPDYAIDTGDGIRHEFWPVTDSSTVENLVRLFGEIPALYIADGHHRSASANKVGEKRRAEHPDYSGNEEFNFFMAVIFPENDLKIFDYNRVVKDLNGLTSAEFIAACEKAGFVITEKGTETYRPAGLHDFSMYLDGKWYDLKAKDEIIPDDVIGALDVSILQENLLGPVLGIGDPRTDKRIDFIGGIRGLGELERRCNADMKVAFAVYPVSLAELLAVADAGMIMPPKSTWFEPKLGSGLFVHEL